jgi:tRNA pseudouridine38-40 synthase
MVRILVGTMLEIGRGKAGPDWVDELLRSGDRTSAGWTIPPHGLFLVRVEY